MSPLRIHVSPLGRGYVAESRVPHITAMGASAEEAAENGRLMALAVFEALGKAIHPSTLIVRIQEQGGQSVAMQAFDRPFSLDGALMPLSC